MRREYKGEMRDKDGTDKREKCVRERGGKGDKVSLGSIP